MDPRACRNAPPAARTRTVGRMLLPALLFILPSCGWDGQLSILGYTTQPNYDMSIKTIRVPMFKNDTFVQGLEFELTRAVVREIEQKTPFKVVGMGCSADTELTGTIIGYTKTIINRNQLNEVREAETLMTVKVVWKDLRSGDYLSRPRPGPGTPAPPPGAPLPPPEVVVQSTGRMIPELGESLATAQQMNIQRLAVQIVSMMEKPW
jgi:hypothetical protein